MSAPATVQGWLETLAAGLRVRRVEQYGPQGRTVTVRALDGADGSVIVTQADQGGVEWLHASIAFQHRDPSYAELALLHRAVFGRRRYAYQVFAPAEDHVNIHQHALHLWGRVDGTTVLPELAGLVKEWRSI